MTLPPFDEDGERVRNTFAACANVRRVARARGVFGDRRGTLDCMSHDYEWRLKRARRVRLGTAIFGTRVREMT